MASLSRNEHLLCALSFVVSCLTNVQHLLHKGCFQGVVTIRYHVFMQGFQFFGAVFFFN